MVTAYDVEGQKLVDALAEKLKGMVKVPEFVYYVKSGAHKERPPDDPEKFWYHRLASLLRKIYLKGPIGVSRLRRIYGGRKNRGSKPERKWKAGGKIIRVALKQLEELGFVEKVLDGKRKGRRITPKGQSFVDNTAKEVLEHG